MSDSEDWQLLEESKQIIKTPLLRIPPLKSVSLRSISSPASPLPIRASPRPGFCNPLTKPANDANVRIPSLPDQWPPPSPRSLTSMETQFNTSYDGAQPCGRDACHPNFQSHKSISKDVLLTTAYSANDVFSEDVRPADPFIFDGIVRLSPFGTKAYVTYNPATTFDLDRHHWLFKWHCPETWLEPSKLQQPGHFDMEDIPDSQAISLGNPVTRDNSNVPLLRATAALTVEDFDEGHRLRVECQLGDPLAHEDGHDGRTIDDEDFSATFPSWWCPKCSVSKREEAKTRGLVYHSIQKAIAYKKLEQVDRGKFAPSRGSHVYRLVQSGSRESAATVAFYDASIHGWSTIFTCVTDSSAEMGGARQKLKRVKELWQVLGQSEQGITNIFY